LLLQPDSAAQGFAGRIDVEPDDVHADVAPCRREFDARDKPGDRIRGDDPVERRERIVISAPSEALLWQCRS
jgi:hypothetical protein